MNQRNMRIEDPVIDCGNRTQNLKIKGIGVKPIGVICTNWFPYESTLKSIGKSSVIFNFYLGL